jgi:hypothetical protein
MALSTLLVQEIANPANRVICVAPATTGPPAASPPLGDAGKPPHPPLQRDDGAKRQAVDRATFEIWITGTVGGPGAHVRPKVAVTAGSSPSWAAITTSSTETWSTAASANTWNNAGVVIRRQRDPAPTTPSGGNLIGNGDQTKLADDFFDVLIGSGHVAARPTTSTGAMTTRSSTGRRRRARDHVELHRGAKSAGIIDGNDVHVTTAKRVDCTTVRRRTRVLLLENGIGQKSEPQTAPDAGHPPVWGYRPTTTAANCGGSGERTGALGQHLPGPTRSARNASTIRRSASGLGAELDRDGNLLHDIRAAGRSYLRRRLRRRPPAICGSVQHGVTARTTPTTTSRRRRTRAATWWSTTRRSGRRRLPRAGHSTECNYLITRRNELQRQHDEFYSTEAESGDAPFCYWRRRWTALRRVCIPFAATTPTSAHYAATAECDADLGVPFGMESITFVAAPEPGATALGVASLLAAAALARRRTGR